MQFEHCFNWTLFDFDQLQFSTLEWSCSSVSIQYQRLGVGLLLLHSPSKPELRRNIQVVPSWQYSTFRWLFVKHIFFGNSDKNYRVWPMSKKNQKGNNTKTWDTAVQQYNLYIWLIYWSFDCSYLAFESWVFDLNKILTEV